MHYTQCYEFDNNLRFTAGLNVTNTEAAMAASGTSATADDTNVGIYLGAGMFVENFFFCATLSTYTVADIDGTSIGLNAGYIPVTLEVADALAALIHPNHIVYLCS